MTWHFEECWPKKYNLPDDLWAMRFSEPKDPMSYFWLRDVYTTDVAATREAAERFGYTDADDVVVVAVRQPGREWRFRKLSLSADLALIDLPEQRQAQGPPQKVPVPTLKRYLGELALSSTLKSLLVRGTPIAYFLNGCSPDLDFTNASIGRAYGGGFVSGLQQLGFETRVLDLSRDGAVPRGP